MTKINIIRKILDLSQVWLFSLKFSIFSSINPVLHLFQRSIKGSNIKIHTGNQLNFLSQTDHHCPRGHMKYFYPCISHNPSRTYHFLPFSRYGRFHILFFTPKCTHIHVTCTRHFRDYVTICTLVTSFSYKLSKNIKSNVTSKKIFFPFFSEEKEEISLNINSFYRNSLINFLTRPFLLFVIDARQNTVIINLARSFFFFLFFAESL